MTDRLQGRVCLITGTAGGQGRAAALAFAAEGARVVGCDMDAVGAADTVSLVTGRGGTMVSVHPCDLTDEDDVARLFRFAVNHFDGLDVLYNNAARAEFAWIEEMSLAMWRRTLAYELDLVFLACRAAWPLLKARGGGSVINTGSASGSIVYRPLGGVAHSAAKAGVMALTRQLAMEGAPYGIRVNTLSPGLIESPASAAPLADAQWRRAMLGQQMLARLGTVDDVVGAAVYLASDESAFVTGANLCVDGGTTAW